jgi:hypothetical protein
MQCCVEFFEWGQNDTGHDYLGRIIELFEKEDSSEWFTVQWFFRASETVSFVLQCVFGYAEVTVI